MTKTEIDKIKAFKARCDLVKAENIALRQRIAEMQAEQYLADQQDEEVISIVRNKHRAEETLQVITFIPSQLEPEPAPAMLTSEFVDYALPETPQKSSAKQIALSAMFVFAMIACLCVWISHRLGWTDLISAITVTVFAILFMGMRWML